MEFGDLELYLLFPLLLNESHLTFVEQEASRDGHLKWLEQAHYVIMTSSHHITMTSYLNLLCKPYAQL